MSKPLVACITLGDARRDFYAQRAHIVEEESGKLREYLATQSHLYMPDPVFCVEEARTIADEIRTRHISCVIVYVPIWGTPNLATQLAYSTDLPVIVVGNLRPDTSSLVALLATAGMLEQGGKQVIRIIGDCSDEKFKKQLSTNIKALQVVENIQASQFCLIGGQSIGIGTTIADFAQWRKLWQLDTEHADQYEVVKRAEAIDDKRVLLHQGWLETKLGAIEFGKLFTKESLNRQIRSYLALKDMVSDGGFDFIALKCQRELSDHYAVQCLAIALLNNPFDAEGNKPVIPCACEGDCDGALTMYLLHQCDKEQPSCLVDIRSYDVAKKEFTFANCGGMAFAYAALNNVDEAMTSAKMMPHVFGEAGGGTTQFMAQPGIITAARLFRKDGNYCMGAFKGEVMHRSRESLVANYIYPHAFIKADIDFDSFVQSIGSNHMHYVYGDYVDELEKLCEIQGIRMYNYTKE